MKKSVLALAAVATTGAVFAQSSVTVFGVLSTGLSGYSTRSESSRSVSLPGRSGSVTAKSTVLSNSAYGSSRLGFRGTEDLGGGLSASFWLEAPLNVDDGTGGNGFSRRSTVSLSGPFGELRLGRDYTPTFRSDSAFDLFSTNGVGANSLVSTASANSLTGGVSGFGGNMNYARADNSIGYLLPPDLGGVYGQVMYALHEKTRYSPAGSTPPGLDAAGTLPTGTVAALKTGRYAGGRIGFAKGPIDMAAAYGESTIGDNHFAGTRNLVKTFNLAASYDFGGLALLGEFSRMKFVQKHAGGRSSGAGIPGVRMQHYMLGVSVPVGAGLIRVSYAHLAYRRELGGSPGPLLRPQVDKMAVGYIHNLSKRTALFATIARARNRDGAAFTVGGPAFATNALFTPRTSTGYDLGVRHSF